MSMVDYWVGELECALEACGAFGALTDEQVESVAKAMMRASDDAGMISGSACAPNPLNAEIRRLQEEHERERREWEKREAVYKNSVARRRGVSPSDVHIERGEVWYGRR